MDQQLPEQPNFTQPKADDEITLKDIILKIQEWWSIVWPQRTKIYCPVTRHRLSSRPVYEVYCKTYLFTRRTNYSFKKKAAVYERAMRLASSFGLGIGGGSASSSTTVQQYLTSRDNISQAMTRRSRKAA